MSYTLLLFIHIASSIVLLGVGGGSAFYKFMADKSKNTTLIHHTNQLVVLADWIFTTPAVILQPLTGFGLIHLLKIPYSLPWLYNSIALYIFAILLWIIALWLQLKMKTVSAKAKRENRPLTAPYYHLVKLWIILGIFSALAMVTILVFMVFK